MTFPIWYTAVDQLPVPLLLAGAFREPSVYLLAVEESSQALEMSITKYKTMKIRDHS